MHELALTRRIVETVCEHVGGPAGAERVCRVVLEVGRLTGVVPDALRFCFDLCAEGTIVEGASLEIREVPGIGRCAACRSEIPLEFPIGLCPCGSPELEIASGRELRIQEVEVA